jgi:hypothetical protein
MLSEVVNGLDLVALPVGKLAFDHRGGPPKFMEGRTGNA